MSDESKKRFEGLDWDVTPVDPEQLKPKPDEAMQRLDQARALLQLQQQMDEQQRALVIAEMERMGIPVAVSAAPLGIAGASGGAPRVGGNGGSGTVTVVASPGGGGGFGGAAGFLPYKERVGASLDEAIEKAYEARYKAMERDYERMKELEAVREQNDKWLKDPQRADFYKRMVAEWAAVKINEGERGITDEVLRSMGFLMEQHPGLRAMPDATPKLEAAYRLVTGGSAEVALPIKELPYAVRPEDAGVTASAGIGGAVRGAGLGRQAAQQLKDVFGKAKGGRRKGGG